MNKIKTFIKNLKKEFIKFKNKITKFINELFKKKRSDNVKKKTNKRKKKKIFKIILLILLICFILGIISIIGFFSYIVVNAPEFSEDLLYVSEPSIILDKDGNEIDKLGAEKRIIITYDEMSESLIDAIIATEDSRFFEHNGVDWARFIKASIGQVMGNSDAGGASTLTMQVSKNSVSKDFTATGIKGILRKFTDIYVSIFKIEKNYTKEQIMEFYVNSYLLGNRSYGVEQAAIGYFGKSAKDLNLSESAMIAGLFQAPDYYNPYKNPDATEKRRKTVLYLMLRHDYITEKEYNTALKLTVNKIIIPKEENPNVTNGGVSEYQSFIDVVVDEVKDKTGFNPYTTPMTIYTTLDTDKQDYVNGIMNGETYTWENDVVKAGIAVLNVKDGSIAAIGGSRNQDSIDQLNHATEIHRQIGSTAKPLYDYGPAIEYQNWNTYNILVDEPITYSDGHSINNWDGLHEGFETMRTALTRSRNIPALKAFKSNNKANVIEFVEKLGLSPEIYSCQSGYELKNKKCINEKDKEDILEPTKSKTLHEAHAIGGYNGESPLTMAAAYMAFANKGTYIEPYSFTKIVFTDTEEEYVNEINKTKAMSEETAYMVSDMLATTATYAMGRFYNINGVRYAAKTGTTNYDQKALEDKGLLWTGIVNDLWTVGFNTEYALGVWYGYDTINSSHYSTINTVQHTKLFSTVGKKIFTNTNYFTQPSTVVSVEIESECPVATLPSEFTPSNLKQTELFIKGTEPTNISPRFDKLKPVNNLKATEKENKVTLTWDVVETPEINTEKYLKKYYDNLFETDQYLNSFISSRLDYNRNYIGNIGYNVYIEENGKLILKGYTSANKYELTLDEAGDYKFVVKTAYSIFKNNMSDGKSVKVNIKSSVIPNLPNDEEEEDNNNNNDDDLKQEDNKEKE